MSRDNIDRVYLEIMMIETWHILAVPITPISFVGFFAAKIPVGRGVKRRSINEIIIQTQGGKIAFSGEFLLTPVIWIEI